MSTEPKTSNGANDGELLPWSECNCFCIHEYSGASASSCGWRGRLQDARRGGSGAALLCPRCGCATLLSLPVRRD